MPTTHPYQYNPDVYGGAAPAMTLLIIAFAIGCIFGSFLNVVIWRVPNGISIVNPKRSFCPNCKAQIRWYDNIPIISYLVLRGKCRDCGEPISARYPLVEALGGILAAITVAMPVWGLCPVWMLPALLVFAAYTIVISFIDHDYQLILNIIVYPAMLVMAALLALASWRLNAWGNMVRAIIAGAALVAIYFLPALIKPGSMGLGDVKLALVIGMTLGWLGWGDFAVGAFFAFVFGGVIGIILIIRKRVDRHGGIPFGPYMFMGAWFGLIFGTAIAKAYLDLLFG